MRRHRPRDEHRRRSREDHRLVRFRGSNCQYEVIRRITTALGSLLALAVLWVVYGGGHLNYDAMYISLVWGQQIAAGSPPDVDAPGTPTAHPLSNLVGAVLAALNATASPVLLVLTYLAAVALIVATGLLARSLFHSTIAGLAAAALVATRGSLGFYTAMGRLDVAFAAVVAIAFLLELQQPRRGAAVFVMLGVAGLLRPEAWLIAGAYWLWLLAAGERAQRTVAFHTLLVAIPPLLWALTDFISTGDPVYSFTDTREAVARLTIPHGFSGIIEALPELLKREARLVVLIGAIGGLVVLLRRPRAGFATGAMAVITAAVLAPIAAGGLLLDRYVLPIVVLLCVLCGGFVTAWLHQPRRHLLWTAAGSIVLLGLIASIPSQIDILRIRRFRVTQVAEQQRDLRGLLAQTRLPRTPIVAPNDRLRPLIAIWRDVPIGDVGHIDRGPMTGTFITGDERAYRNLVYLPARDPRPPTAPPCRGGSRRLARRVVARSDLLTRPPAGTGDLSFALLDFGRSHQHRPAARHNLERGLDPKPKGIDAHAHRRGGLLPSQRITRHGLNWTGLPTGHGSGHSSASSTGAPTGRGDGLRDPRSSSRSTALAEPGDRQTSPRVAPRALSV